MENRQRTVKELANELKISKQALYKRMNSKPIQQELKQHLFTEVIDGKPTTVIDKQGVELLTGKVNRQLDRQLDRQQMIENDRQLVDFLKEQIAVKDKQIEMLNEQLKQQNELYKLQLEKLTELNRNQQVLLQQSQQQKKEKKKWLSLPFLSPKG